MSDPRVRPCSSCSAPIIWLKTNTGANMPTDADAVTIEDALFDYKKHKSHFATCPNANQHRRKK